MITGIFLVSYTGAAFNDIENLNSSLHVKWPVELEPPEGEWDKSSLEFIGYGGSCTSIYAVVKNGNDSEAMAGPVQFEVYWIDKGNAMNGEVVHTGTIDPLGPGESVTLEHTPDRSGNYKFKAFQRPGHPGAGELWSDGPEGIVCDNSLDTTDQDNKENSDSITETPEGDTNENGDAADTGTDESADAEGNTEEVEGNPADGDDNGGSTDGEGSETDEETEAGGETNTDTADSEANKTTGGTTGNEGS
ncbi:TasA anchoring/assembly protein [Bacillus oleivorans]